MSAASVSAAPDPRDALRDAQLLCMLPADRPATPGTGYVFTSKPVAAAQTLRSWFPLMPDTGGPAGLLLGDVTMSIAQFLYVNVDHPADAGSLGDGFAYGPAAPGGVLLFHGQASLDGITLLTNLMGRALGTVAMQGTVDFASGYPVLMLTPAITIIPAPNDLRLSLGCPLYPMPGDARVQLAGTIHIAADEQVALMAEVDLDGPIMAAATLQSGQSGIAKGIAPGVPPDTLSVAETLQLSLVLARRTNGLMLDRIAFSAAITDWQLCDGWLTIDSATADIQVQDPLGARTAMASITAQARFGRAGKTQLEVQGQGSVPTGGFVFSARPVNLGALLQLFDVTEPTLDGLTVTTCSIAIDPQRGTIAASLAVAGSWTVGRFTLTRLAVQASGPAIAASVAGAFSLGSVAFAARVDYAAGKWAGAASAVAGAGGIRLAEILGELGVTGPGVLDAVSLTALSLSWTTDGGLSLAVGGNLALGPGFAMNLAWDTKTSQGEGQLTIGSQLLDLTMKDGDVNFTNPQPIPSLGLVDVAGWFGMTLPSGAGAIGLTNCTIQIGYETLAPPKLPAAPPP